MRLKKFTAFALAICMLFSLAACATEYEKYTLLPNAFLLGESLSDSGEVVTGTDGYNDTVQLTARDIADMNDGDAQMVFNDQGYLTFLNGKYYDKIIKDQEDAVLSLQGVASLIGIGAGSEFYCEYGEKDPHGYTYYTFKQRYGEGTVQYGTLRVIIDPDGYAAGLSCSFTPNLGIAENETGITAQQAEQVVRQTYAHLNLAYYSQYTKKIVVTYNNTVFSAYAVYTNNPDSSAVEADMPYFEHIVSYDGTILYALPTATLTDDRGGDRAEDYFEGLQPATCTATVTLYDGTTKQVTVPTAYSPNENTYYLMDVERKIAVADYSKFIYQGYPKFSQSATGQEWDNNHLIAYANYIKVYDFFADKGIHSVDGAGVPILICCDWVDENGTPVNNACHMGMIQGWVVFGASDANTYCEAVDVIAHEFTHGVTTYSMGGMQYLNHTGAINEAYSDIMGNIVEMSMGATYDTNQWLLGEMSGVIMRSMSDPHAYKQPTSLSDPYYYPTVPKDQASYEKNDNGGVHYNNSLLSQMAYILWNSGMSYEELSWLWITSIELITPLAEYEEVYEALMMSAEINGLRDKYGQVITNAFAAAQLISAGGAVS